MTLVVNLFAGPGTGKSTTAALVFGKLKSNGYNAEIVHEFAKDLTWEKRQGALAFQPYVFGKQAWHIERLIGEVDVVITDSPILLCGCIYGNGTKSDVMLAALALVQFGEWDTYNVLLERNAVAHPYNPAGRNQTEQEAEEIDARIEHMLTEYEIDYDVYTVLHGEATADRIVDKVMELL